MIAEGAKGGTKEILDDYLGTNDFAAYAKEYLDKIKAYNTEDESYGYQSKVKIADAVWVDNGLTLQEKFKNTVSNSFGAEVEAVDFSAAEKTCDVINSWCDKNTEGLIPKIITPDLINDNTGLCRPIPCILSLDGAGNLGMFLIQKKVLEKKKKQNT